MSEVLVVDDIGMIRHALAAHVRQLGWSVETCASGIEALHFLKRNPGVRFALIDELMPGMSGVQLFRAARQLERCHDGTNANEPQFFLMVALDGIRPTPRLLAARESEARVTGFHGVLFKPSTLKDLRVRLGSKDLQPAQPAVKVAARPPATPSLKTELQEIALRLTALSAVGIPRVGVELQKLLQQLLEDIDGSDSQIGGSRGFDAENEHDPLMNWASSFTAMSDEAYGLSLGDCA